MRDGLPLGSVVYALAEDDAAVTALVTPRGDYLAVQTGPGGPDLVPSQERPPLAPLDLVAAPSEVALETGLPAARLAPSRDSP